MTAEKSNIPPQERLSGKERVTKALWTTAMLYWEGVTGQTLPEGWLKTSIGLKKIEAYANEELLNPRDPETDL